MITRIISLYLTKTFLKSFMAISASISIIILVFDFAEFVRKTAHISFPSFRFAIQMVLLKLPTLIQDLFPFIILFSAILGLWRLNRSHEITIMRAAGMSIYQILKPLMITVLLIGMFNLSVINPLAANLMLRYERLYDYHYRSPTGGMTVAESGLWLREFNRGYKTFYHIHNVDIKNNQLSNITLYQFDQQDRFIKRVDAQQAVLKDNQVICRNAWVVDAEQFPQHRDHYAMASSITFADLKNQGIDPKSLSFWTIPDYIKLLKRSGLNDARYQLHWHRLIAQSFWLSVMIIFAASCALQPIRRGKTFTMIINGIALTFFLYFLQDIMYALGDADKIPTIMAAWSPVLISSFVSIAVLLHFEEST